MLSSGICIALVQGILHMPQEGLGVSPQNGGFSPMSSSMTNHSKLKGPKISCNCPVDIYIALDQGILHMLQKVSPHMGVGVSPHIIQYD